MCGQLALTRPDHDDARARPQGCRRRLTRTAARRVRFGAQREIGLPAGHGEIHLGEDARVEQGAVIIAMRVVDRVALAQGVETVALAGMHLPRERQSVEHAAQVSYLERKLDAREFGIQEGDVEGSVVNDDLRLADELKKLRL